MIEIEESVSFLEIKEAGKKVPEATVNRRLHIENNNGEQSLNMVLVVEDFRAGFYIAFFVCLAVGVMLTKAFAEGDVDRYLLAVYGVPNICIFFDFAPSTYVLPALWCFAMFSGIIYAIAAIFRIQVSYLEMKLSRCAAVLLIIVFIYVVLSMIYFSMIFAVQPDPEEPVTMIIHSLPYLNIKWTFGLLQIAIVYYGIKVSWVGLNFPRWFYIGSVIHAIALNVVNIASTVWAINCLGDMGTGMEGKGLWWSVQSESSKLWGNILGLYLGTLLMIILPLLQALYICRKGMISHALFVAISDNRLTADNEVKNHDNVIIDISRRLQIENDNGEYSLHMAVVIEDFRAGLYTAFLVIVIIGVMLTWVFTNEDNDIYVRQVYGVTNLSTVFDFAPSTYVLPSLWCFAMFSGIMYSIAAILRIRISYLEMKLSRRAAVLLIIVYVYVVLSLIYFSMIFAVQPDPEEPVTMIIHAVPYINLKWTFGLLQIAIVYYGIKVSWVGLNFPRWFYMGSVIHAIALTVVNIATTVLNVNALGDMGAGMEGKGLWWSVQSESSKWSSNILGNYLGTLLMIILPLIQALYVCRNGLNSHALLVAVSDNRVTAYKKLKNHENCPEL